MADDGARTAASSAAIAGGGLVERSTQLTVLAEQLASTAATARGRLVLIGGEAGGGKTALVRAFCDGAEGRPRVLSGACDGLLTARPLGPFLDIGATAARVADSVATEARPHDVASALLADVGRTPTIVVLEDVHWADEATLDVLRLLARRVESAPALVLATYRDELRRTHPLRLLLGELPPDRVTRLKVPPLSADAVALLARTAGVDPAELYRKTGGNPFFVSEVLAAPDGGIPDTVRDAVLARCGRLSEQARGLLEAVAVAPHHTEAWLLEATAPESVDALDECVASGMLTAAGATVAFRHELARRAVEETIPPRRRRALHRAALVALSSPPSGSLDLALLSHHAEGSGDAHAVVRFAPAAAARASSLGAHREAEAEYARALRFADLIDPQVRARILEQHAQECYLTNKGVAAIASGQRAVATYREIGDRMRESAALCELSTIQRINGRLGDAADSVTAALALLDGLPVGRELARAYAATAQIAMCNGDREQTFAAGACALDLARGLGDVPTVIHTLITLGTMEMESGETVDDGLDKLRRSIAMAKEARLDDLVGRASNNLAYEGFAIQRLDLVDACLREAIQHHTERGLDLWLQVALGSRAELEMLRGDWDAATETAAIVLARPGTTVPRMSPLTVIGLVRGRRGDPGAWGALDEALDIARSAGELQMLVAVSAARAEVAWLEGDDARAIAETDSVVAAALRAGADATYALPDLAYWRRQAGVSESLPIAGTSPRRLQLDGDPERAADEWLALGYRYEAALARADCGDETSLRRAFDELRRLGARATATVIARRLRERGARGVPRGPRRQTASNPAGLTDREVEVTALIAKGLRDADIAAQLHLSAKTVGHHVSAILHKLGVRTRGQAGVEAVRLGLLPSDPR